MKALPAMDVAGRAGRLRGLFGEAEVDALLVTSLPNVRYLTSFTGSAGIPATTCSPGSAAPPRSRTGSGRRWARSAAGSSPSRCRR